ncbi:MAG: alpha/beta hydrolase [Pseudomonas sp.]
MIERRQIRSRSLRSRLLSLVLRRKLKPVLTAEHFDPLRFRAWLERNSAKRKTAPGVRINQAVHASIEAEWNIPDAATPGRCILYLHGGGYIFGSPRTYRSFTTRLAKLAGSALLSLDYRLAPEHPFPAAVDDALAAYDWLLQSFPASGIVLAGDSAGGGLTLALLLALKARGRTLPAAAILLSPYTDMLASGESLHSNGRSCVMFDARSIQRAAAIYLNGQDGNLPLASPLYGDFAGLPPLAIHVSDNEALRDDSYRLADRLDEAGVSGQMTIWRGQAHVWPTFYPLLPEADACLRDMVAFARQHWQAAPDTGSSASLSEATA